MYITDADVAKLLNINLTLNGQSLVNMLIQSTQKYIETETNRVWSHGANDDITELFDGGTDSFFVTCPPVNSIVSVTVGGSVYSSDDYYNMGSFIRLDTPAQDGYRNVQIIYRTQATSAPDDVKLALVRWCAELFKAQDDAGKTVSRVSALGLSVDYLTQDGIPKYVEQVISHYRLSP